MGPYRTNLRPDVDARARRAKKRAPISVYHRIGTPLFFGVASVVIAACCFGELNTSEWMLRPELHAQEVWLAGALLLTIPIVLAWLVAAWWRLPAPRALKRRHVLRATTIQLAVVLVGVAAILVTRPRPLSILASASAPDGRVGFALAREGHCNYEIAVSNGDYGLRWLTAIGPFPCDGPPPKIVWRGRVMVLLDPDGKEVGRWFDEP